MRRPMLSIAAAFVLAAPASAQLFGGIVGTPNDEGSRRIVPITLGVGPQLGDIDDSIDDGRDAGQLSKHEAKVLRRDNRQIGAMQERFGRDGLSPDEAAELQARVEVLRAQVNFERMRDHN